MVRLFAAIPIPEKNRKQLHSYSHSISGAKWVPLDNYHITLAFFGTVNIWHYLQLKNQLKQFIQEPYSLKIKGLDIFTDNSDKPRVLWAGIQENELLKQLHVEIKNLAYNMGVEMGENTFTPHISLARLDNTVSPKEVHEFLEKYRNVVFGEFMVNGFGLYSSRLTQNGAVHTKVSDYVFND